MTGHGRCEGRRSWGLAGCFAALQLLALSAARAADGVIEINQAAVMASGGFPYTIQQPGGYKLTSDLDLVGLDPALNAIQVSAEHVVLDLNGFAIRGQCPGPLGSCPTASTSGGAIVGGTNVWIRNGTVRGMSSTAISVGYGARIEGLRVIGNHYLGIVTGSNALLRSNVVTGNGWDGISAQGRSLAIGNVADGNMGTGILLDTGNYGGSVARENSANGNPETGIAVGGDSCVVSGNTASDNSDGISVGGACQVSGNVANSNRDTGISVGSGSNVTANTTRGNGKYGIWATGDGARIESNTVQRNGTEGIHTIGGSGALLVGNAVSSSPVGLALAADSVHLDNVIEATAAVSGGIPIGSNSCNGATSCP